uniref:Uncharacterized protein n=1 Tax=Chromera velia CCMP2878 TaxID=1169474 RepID=A0A0G4IFS1_9ALVE|eukprot:Cvel_13992.t1-p1 / transcript=Cvel_13992.t1 / gene=Cvel_13992 / organism=Chromera_velia_CCMP2878 / gene_product=hypothetical protein / transcript_product=hypothetical protein / location=Cvel_scaffold978:30324-34460(-) / protein_length=614 / sequence_SO=supercontig / SO=protein_coding / is_pseudo=false
MGIKPCSRRVASTFQAPHKHALFLPPSGVFFPSPQCPCLLRSPRVILLHGHKGDSAQTLEGWAKKLNERKGSAFSLRAPPCEVYGTFHPKVAILKYRLRDSQGSGRRRGGEMLRVGIFTANYVSPDWWRKNQGLWVQDFPLWSASLSRDGGERPLCPSIVQEAERRGREFLGLLEGFVKRAGGAVVEHAGWAETLRRFDFSTVACSLVPSVPGRHRVVLSAGSGGMTQGGTGGGLDFGILRLSALVQRDRERGGQVHPQRAPSSSSSFGAGDMFALAQFSSMGSLNEKWMADFCCAMRGNLNRSLGKTSASSSSPPGPPAPLSLVLPTVEDVRTSVEGWAAGESIPIPKKNWEGRPFLRSILCRWKDSGQGSSHDSATGGGREAPSLWSLRETAMPHIKTFGVFFRKRERDQTVPSSLTGVSTSSSSSSSSSSSAPPSASSAESSGRHSAGVGGSWVYVGSHNLSKAAWGELQLQGSQLFIRSFELGVFFSPSTLSIVEPCVRPSGCVNREGGTWGRFEWRLRSDAVDASVSPELLPLKSVHSLQSDDHRAMEGEGSETRVFFLPLPYPVPPSPYKSSDEPWNCSDPRRQADCWGFPFPSPALRMYGYGDPSLY